MRRRERPVPLGDGPPPTLVRFRYADWADESEQQPPHHAGESWPSWRHIRAFRRHLHARRRWCAETGRSYVETFRPEWSRWTDHESAERHP
ncbi:hypothetical protein [Micromonospora inyonensis]|uniref:Uncharacterized protein n=1 Tax=Micromonospora inyonensis TaxID=47866 RepID=A0A1C6RTB8_9ACTN|nr:hypothetical protein [Micromonospora inyonensis]SCL20469.1 hypothetical protein GA0074694_3047 [Micromonospora inyonensis]SCL25457.1 hypothetical protein GA0074694_4226 [Micromonospora inyonensis]SCL32245.1 hypothetical protein GA0074694_6206 [Micromonospora inyonensis]